MSWTRELFEVDKPIIAMCHLRALPGDPGYDREAGVEAIVSDAMQSLRALQDGGVDGVMFSNEASLPYQTRVDSAVTATMARIVGELRSRIHVPFGVNVLWDPVASIDLAVATGARFVREIFTGAYASDFGIWDTDCGRAVRHRHAVGADGVRLLFNIVPEAAAYLAPRDPADIARSTVFNARPDALCVSGMTAGVETPMEVLRSVKEAVPDTFVFANTGVRPDNVVQQLSIADGAIVGSAFKKDGYIWNAVDEARVDALMEVVRRFRDS